VAVRYITDLAFYLDNLDYPPTQLHIGSQPHRSKGRGLRSTVGNKSGLGSPALTRSFESWVESPYRRDIVGYGPTERSVIRWPMRAAMAKVRKHRVTVGYPKLDVTLAAIAAASGGLFGDPEVVLTAAADSLSRSYPAMLDPENARKHLELALRRARKSWARFSDS
jgi:hypothetical protein